MQQELVEYETLKNKIKDLNMRISAFNVRKELTEKRVKEILDKYKTGSVDGLKEMKLKLEQELQVYAEEAKKFINEVSVKLSEVDA